MGYSPLLLTPDNSTGSITKTLNAIIKEQYGDSRDAVERFGRIPREKILLLVDDFDMLKRKARKGEVIQSMLQTAGSIILWLIMVFNLIWMKLLEPISVTCEFVHGRRIKEIS